MTEYEELVKAWEDAGHMPYGNMTRSQWSVFAGLYNAVGNIIEKMEMKDEC